MHEHNVHNAFKCTSMSAKAFRIVHFYNKHRIRSQDSNRKIENTSQHEHTEQLSLSLIYYPVTMQIKKF